jgi:hypothetical protein
MVQMAAQYGHFTLEEFRGAVESISKGEQVVSDFQAVSETTDSESRKIS